MMTLFMSLLTIPLFAQNTVIKGQVFDAAHNEPLIGVTIAVKGTNTGTLTDIDGEFELSLANVANTKLQFTYLGYKTLEVALKNNAFLKIEMEEDQVSIEEVVVVGYGTQKKESFVGSIASIDNSSLVALPVSNISQGLVGKLAGVQIVQPSGEVGRDEANIYVRGAATFDDARPLILIDGVVRESFAQLDPNEIQSINILKDASATAVFGVKGANGVIIVTTRRGTSGKPQVSFSAQYAVTQPTRIPNPLGSYQASTLFNVSKYANGEGDTYTALDLIKYRTGSSPYLHPDTHWVDEVMKDNSSLQQYNINISGGNTFLKYFVSGGFLDQDGFYKHDPYTNFSRYNFRSNLDFDITKRFQLGVNLGARIEKRQYPGAARWSSWDIYRGAFSTGGRSSTVYNPDGSLASPTGQSANNLIGVISQRGIYKETKSVIEAALTFKHDLDFITKGLSIKGQLAFDNAGVNGESWEQNYAGYNYRVSRVEATDSDQEVYTMVGENTPLKYSWGSTGFDQKIYGEVGIEYVQTFDKHSVTALFLANRSHRLINNFVDFADQGVVGRLTYDYDKRYFAEVNAAYNGSENFAKGKRYDLFPSFALGWVASNEKFITESSISKVISYLKFRGSMGWVGNSKSGDITKEENQNDRFAYLQEFTNGGGAAFGTGNVWYQGIVQGNISNPNLTWETGKKMNAGFELGVFNDLLRVNTDLFYEKRSDILTNINPINPGYVGQTFKRANVGVVENQGFEVEVTHRKKIGKDFSYTLKGNYSFTQNKVLQEADALGMLPYQRVAGYAIGTPLAYQAIGVFADYDEIANSPSQMGLNGNTEVKPGDIKYLDFNNDGIIDVNDAFRQGYGNIPEIQYGITLSMEYKNFDFSILFQGSAHSAFIKNWEIMWPFSNADNVYAQHWGYWTPETANESEYIRFYGNYLNNQPQGGTNSYTIGSGDYVRLKNLEVGYTFPKSWTSKLYMTSARIYFSGNNLALWADEPYLDPDNRDVRGGLMPQSRAFNFGVNINF